MGRYCLPAFWNVVQMFKSLSTSYVLPETKKVGQNFLTH
jgi:hypothetical protein